LRITRGSNWRARIAPTTGASDAFGADTSGRASGLGASASALDVVREPAQAAALLYHPLRLRILAALLEPDSATGVARRMNLPRQTVNYHVRELARARFLARAGRRRRRHLYEQCYVTTARGYVLSPELLGKLAADPAQIADTFSARYLLGLASKVQSELARSVDLAAAAGKRVATLSINTELRFTSPEQRASFTEDLQRAVVEVAARHSAPYRNSDGSPAEGRPYRLVLGCYPIPPAAPAQGEASTNQQLSPKDSKTGA
jgi:DNA-binding transcriptional ArsR family regulator